ncbi:IS1182 family transposase [Nocardioides sp. LMS-CY]|uniref:IS1182 family transposase n=1 Tax=Nocardioides sp. (strain LMS-CY) TaxID=2840457 RepID=UPI001C004931|nr:IS1182 family transposase [Nocardioides sp. LMS-CY]QWF20467.1 IS1182 family transposase [Nocardioides sp. LMS-CY]
MAYNFSPVDREQLLLMPPSVAEWLPDDHLAWFVIDVVAELDISAFLTSYRTDGRGGAAYDPQMMLALLVYAYCVGERSSRKIEKRLAEDVAFRVVAANQQPDHATIARFRANHETVIAGLFGQILAVCARTRLLRPGLVAIDGTKLSANASRDASRTAEQIGRELAEEILAEAETTDAVEDAEAVAAGHDMNDGPDSGGAGLRGRGGRRARLRALLDELEAEAAEKSYEAHLARRAEQEAATGKPIRGRRPTPGSATHKSRRQANLTDPDSRLLKTKEGYLQGYNAQAVATTDQFVVAAEVTNIAMDAPAYAPMITAAKTNLKAAGERRRVRRVVADAGYWSVENVGMRGVESFIAPGRARQLKKIAEAEQARAEILDRVEAKEIDTLEASERLGVTRARVNQLLRRRRTGDPDPLTTTMIAKLDTPRGRRTYKRRAPSIEPVFAQIKHNRGIRTISRRGLSAADSEWKLICATHNLLKVYRLA